MAANGSTPIKIAAVSIVVVVAAVTTYHYFKQAQQLPDGLIQANGRIEGDTMLIASKHPGKITAVHVDEGDDVQEGQVLVELDDISAMARLAQRQAESAAATAQADQCRSEYQVVCEEVPNSIDAAKEAVIASEARAQQAEAERRQAEKEYKRYRSLAESSLVGAETAERAELRWRIANDAVTAARATLAQARDALKDVQLGPVRINAKEAQLAALEAATDAAQARVTEAENVVDELSIRSPSSGTVTMRLADLGEVVNSGTPLLEVVDLDRLYLKVFIPEVDIGKVRLGLDARIHVDAFPGRPFSAKVKNIASRAEFTPKEIQTSNERVKLVYAVKLYVENNPGHSLTPGLPADAVIRWRENTEWAEPRW